MATARGATLCTVARDPEGYPYGSLVTVAFDAVGRPLFLLSTLEVDATPTIETLAPHAPNVAKSFSRQVQTAATWLATQIPPVPKWGSKTLSPLDQHEFLVKVDAVDHPVDAILGGLARGDLQRVQVDAVKNGAPDMYRTLKGQIDAKLQKMIAGDKKLPYVRPAGRERRACALRGGEAEDELMSRPPPNQIRISSTRLERAEHYGWDHDEVTIWNRGGNSGTLRVAPGDGQVIIQLLLRASGPASLQPTPEGVITSALSELVGGHDRIQVFNRGKHAGELVVRIGDGEPIAAALRG